MININLARPKIKVFKLGPGFWPDSTNICYHQVFEIINFTGEVRISKDPIEDTLLYMVTTQNQAGG